MLARNGLQAPGLVAGTGLGQGRAKKDRPRIGDDSTTSTVAIGGRRKAVAVDADRHHGEGCSPGTARDPLRQCRLVRIEGTAGASGVTVPLLAGAPHFSFQLAEL